MKAPCKNCPDRHYKCHSECENYLKFLAEKAENEKRKQSIRLENNLIDDQIKRIMNWRKK